jgi:hypothetical protein
MVEYTIAGLCHRFVFINSVPVLLSGISAFNPDSLSRVSVLFSEAA